MFDEIVPSNALALIQDVFGNYVSRVSLVLLCIANMTRYTGYSKAIRTWHTGAKNCIGYIYGDPHPLSVSANVWLSCCTEGMLSSSCQKPRASVLNEILLRDLGRRVYTARAAKYICQGTRAPCSPMRQGCQRQPCEFIYLTLPHARVDLLPLFRCDRLFRS